MVTKNNIGLLVKSLSAVLHADVYISHLNDLEVFTKTEQSSSKQPMS